MVLQPPVLDVERCSVNPVSLFELSFQVRLIFHRDPAVATRLVGAFGRLTVAVGAGVFVAVAVLVAVGVFVGVPVLVGVSVTVGVCVAVGVDVAVMVPVGVGVVDDPAQPGNLNE
jgi:hypothetical protein